MSYFKEQLKNITTFIFDIDGVLTDGSVLLHPDGDLIRTMNVKDGFAVKEAIQKGYHIGVISGGRSGSVRKRLLDLGVKDIHLGVHDKITSLERFLEDVKVPLSECLYMGDDLPDFHTMQKVQLATAPNDAVDEIKSIAHYVSPVNGGRGCVRDVIEQVLKAQNKWFNHDGVPNTIMP